MLICTGDSFSRRSAVAPDGPREAFPYPGYVLPQGRSPPPSSLLIRSTLGVCLSLSSSLSLRKTLGLAFQASHLVSSPPCLCRVCYRQWLLPQTQTLRLSVHLAQGTNWNCLWFPAVPSPTLARVSTYWQWGPALGPAGRFLGGWGQMEVSSALF